MTDTLKPLTSADLADLKAKAKAATPGERTYKRDGDYWEIQPINIGGKDNQEGNEDDYLFIAASNPETILRLIDMIERRDEQIEKLRELLARGMIIANLDEVSFNTDFVNEAQQAIAATEPHNE